MTSSDNAESVCLFLHSLSTIPSQKDCLLPGTLLERLDTTSPSSAVSPNPLLNIGHESTPGPVEPPAERTTHPTTSIDRR